MSRRAEEFVRIATQFHDEQSAARPLVEQMCRQPATVPHRLLPITAGMVQQLITAAREQLEQAPETSAMLARRAISVAAGLDDSYPRVLRAQLAAAAWKEVSNGNRYRSDGEGALVALDRADAEIADEPALGHDRAVLALARATALGELDRIGEALPLLDRASEVFRDHGDAARVAQCELLAGMLHHRRHDAGSAAEAYRRAITSAREAHDVQTIASAYTNLGVLDAEQGRTSAALESLQQARAIFRELHAHGELARASWGIGLALLTASRFEAAIPVLRDARKAFASLAMIEEAGLAGVELAEAYLALERHAAAHRLIVAVIEEFRVANLNERALLALAYLRDLGPAARPESARRVYSYLARLRARKNF